ncbi:MAG: hypothetical protein WCA35_04465, partial [Kovacikia sp.]
NASSIAARKDKGGKAAQTKSSANFSGKVSETSPPSAIQELGQELENYQPQIVILSPKPDEVLSNSKVSVRFQVKDLPIFKDEKLGLGPHLHVLLDNRTYQAVYDINNPLVFEDLEPGTHTLRAFASRPWHESFKNDGAYAQSTFHVFTKTQENRPDPALPLLTYSRPQGSYGAEPIMLDFYLTNAPLHLVARESDRDDIADWRIRCTINGESFILDRWQPVYLKGFKPGQNWIQLEFLDEKGNLVNNVFNNTARVITYEPNGKDTLAQLVRGDLAVAAARGIVDPNFVPQEPQPIPTPPATSSPIKPEPTPSPTLSIPPLRPAPTPTSTSTSTPTSTPTTKASPTPKARVRPIPAEPKPVSPTPTLPQPASTEAPSSIQEKVTSKTSDRLEPPEKAEPKLEAPQPTPPEAKSADRPSPSSFWERFRKPAASPRPSPSPIPVPSPAPETEGREAPPPKSGESPDALPIKTLEPTVAPPKRVPPVLTAPDVPSVPKSPQVQAKPRPKATAGEVDRPRPSPSPILLPSAAPSPGDVSPVQAGPKVRSTSPAGKTTPTPPSSLPSPPPSLKSESPAKPSPEKVAPEKVAPAKPSPEKVAPQVSGDKPAEPPWFEQFKSRLDRVKSNFNLEELRARVRRPEPPAPASTKPAEAIPDKVKAIVPEPAATSNAATSNPVAPANPVTPTDRVTPVKPGPSLSPTDPPAPKISPESPKPSKKSSADEIYERLLRSTPAPTLSPSASPSLTAPPSGN